MYDFFQNMANTNAQFFGVYAAYCHSQLRYLYFFSFWKFYLFIRHLSYQNWYFIVGGFFALAGETLALLDDPARKLQSINFQWDASKSISISAVIFFIPTMEVNYEFCGNRTNTQTDFIFMINAPGSRSTSLDLQHPGTAPRALHANNDSRGCDKGVSILNKLQYIDKFEKFPPSCASHRAIHKNKLTKFDDEYRRLARMVVDPPANITWAPPWGDWVEQRSTSVVGLPWAATLFCHMQNKNINTCLQCCNFALGTVDPQESGMEHQKTTEKRATSRHFGNCAGKIPHCIWKSIENWIAEAAACDPWMQLKHDFSHVAHWIWRMICNFSSSEGPRGRTYHVANLKKIAGENIHFAFPRSLVASDECGLVAGCWKCLAHHS